jgi:hypothetical protein
MGNDKSYMSAHGHLSRNGETSSKSENKEKLMVNDILTSLSPVTSDEMTRFASPILANNNTIFLHIKNRFARPSSSAVLTGGLQRRDGSSFFGASADAGQRTGQAYRLTVYMYIVSNLSSGAHKQFNRNRCNINLDLV